jgi:hypothetical protein
LRCEQRLVAVRKATESRAQEDSALDQPIAEPRGFEAQAERAASDAEVPKRFDHRGIPARLEARVGVQEQDDRAQASR